MIGNVDESQSTTPELFEKEKGFRYPLPPTERVLGLRKKIFTRLAVEKVEPGEQLGSSTLRFVFVHVAYTRCFILPETKNRTLRDKYLRDGFE